MGVFLLARRGVGLNVRIRVSNSFRDPTRFRVRIANCFRARVIHFGEGVTPLHEGLCTRRIYSVFREPFHSSNHLFVRGAVGSRGHRTKVLLYT